MTMQKSDSNFIYHKVGGHEILFEISDEDISSDPMYFGYLAENGSWIIQQRTVSTGAYRYAMGVSGYATAWTGRAALSYALYNAL